MGIEFNSNLDKVFSVWIEKLFLMSDINYDKSESITINKGLYGYTNIFYDKIKNVFLQMKEDNLKFI